MPFFATNLLETNLASRWEGVRLPRASGKSPDYPGSSPNFPGSFSATSPEVLSLWNLTAIQRFPGSFPDLPESFADFPGGFPDFPGGPPLPLGSLTPSPDSQKLSLTKNNRVIAVSHKFCVRRWLLQRRERLVCSDFGHDGTTNEQTTYAPEDIPSAFSNKLKQYQRS